MVWTAEMIISALELTAIRRSAALGHRLGTWSRAKRKHGNGAIKGMCLLCGKHALLLPHGYAKARNRAAKDTPGMRGDALFYACLPIECAQVTGAERGHLV